VSILHSTQAVVLRSQSFGESDRIVCFLTQDHGKLTGIAKGAKRSRRRFVNSLEPFSIVNLRFQDYPHRSLAFVHGCELLRGFRQLTQNLDRIACAAYLTEITAELVREREESEAIFAHVRDGLIYLDEQQVSGDFLTFFELRLLRLAGYDPMFDNCCRCKKKRNGATERWSFSHRDGGILCAGCAQLRKDSLTLSEETLRALCVLRAQEAFAQGNSSTHPTVLREARLVLPRFIQFQVSKELKSMRFLNSFCTF
jgi:DNA repair protein RecO (recombination protein O)